MLADFGCGMLLIEHDMSVVMSLCPRVQILADGTTLRTGTPEEIQADPAVIEAYLGHSFLAGAVLELRDIRISYGGVEVVHGVDLEVGAGEVLG